MNNSSARKAHEKKLSSTFRQLRLVAVDVILCYGMNRNSLREDIHHADHVCELSEEYAFRALCLWLVTTPGSSVYSDAIQLDLARVANCLSAVFLESGAYPFANDFADGMFQEFLERAETLLDGCSASIEMLGSLYEHIHKFPLHFDAQGNFDIPTHIHEKDKRRLVGQFYTPAHIVDYCFERAIGAEKDKFIIGFKSFESVCEDGHTKPNIEGSSVFPNILDPSCGTGNFLLGAVRLFKKHSLASSPSLLVDFAGDCLFGLELDGRAASLTRAAIVIALVDSWIALPPAVMKASASQLLRQLRRNIKNLDTLYAAPDVFGDENAADAARFSLVITNPPYVSFGARNQPKLIESATTYFRNKYPDSAEYKIRIHSIFQDIALRLANSGGVASLLIPDGFLTGGYYKKLRQLLLFRSKLRSFAELPADTVPGAVVGRWCVATYERTRVDAILNANASIHTDISTNTSTNTSTDTSTSTSTDTITGTNASFSTVSESVIDYPVELYSHIDDADLSYILPKSLLVSRDQGRFRLVFNSIDQQLCEAIDKLEPLSTQFQGRTGIRALHGQSSVVGGSAKGDKWKRGITSGSAVLPHVVTWKGDWLNIDPTLLYKGGFDAKVIENPKILIRQTGDSLIAAYDAEGLYHLNNVHSLSNRANSRLSLHFVDGLLNSRFFLYLYRLKTREQGRALAQVDIETLESMPLPRVNVSLEIEIASLTQLYRKMEAASSQDMQRRIERAIDKLVYEIYELDETIVRQIERCCGKLSDSTVGFPTAGEMLTLQKLAESHEVVCRS